MKNLILMILMIFASNLMYSQVECIDDLPDIVDCNSGVQVYNASGCDCNSNNPTWYIDGILINTSIQTPFNFNSGNVSGTVVHVSSTKIEIDWDCPEDCCGDIISIDIFWCGGEWFNPIVRIRCPECPGGACGIATKDCIVTDCDCVKYCGPSGVVILENTSGDLTSFCFPEGTEFGAVVACNETLNCSRAEPESSFNFIEIPEVEITSFSQAVGSATIKIELPNGRNSIYSLIISDSSGNVVYNNSFHNQEMGVVELNGLKMGIYHLVLSNKQTTITQKLYIHTN